MENNDQQIRERAYEIWEFRQGCGMLFTLDRLGNIREINEQDDWLEAEDEIRHAERFHGQFDIKKK